MGGFKGFDDDTSYRILDELKTVYAVYNSSDNLPSYLQTTIIAYRCCLSEEKGDIRSGACQKEIDYAGIL